ncbi:hypothetical protein CCACVL1_12552 [Corchorus capsularis]|uniref:Uncharacterized protein n=1 Tax=Corchorus capsularis TaxID=210143 RepID=A0A1R3IF59_COCAP|nr:hypothetical protein CCACVL1_12552 [Corchorus capsularis]
MASYLRNTGFSNSSMSSIQEIDGF